MVKAMRFFGLFFGSLILSLACAQADARAEAPLASATSLADGKTHYVFDIIRNGDKIGTNTIDIQRQEDTTKVDIATKISVVVMFLEAYRYEHTCTESWKGGQLVSFKSKTNDNGTKHVIDVAAKPDKASMEVDGKRVEAPKSLYPASLWSREAVNRGEMFEPANGKKLAIKVKDLGEETVTVSGIERRARHYKLSSAKGDGEFDRELWFDGDVLVRMKLAGSDGSTILSDLRPTP
jgi:hypothetical protein